MYFHQNILQIIRICRVKSCEHFICSRCQNSKYLNCTGIYVLSNAVIKNYIGLFVIVFEMHFGDIFNVEFSKISVTKSKYELDSQICILFIVIGPLFIYKMVNKTMKFHSKPWELNFLGRNYMVVRPS